MEPLILIALIVSPIIGLIVLLYGAGLCIDEKCRPLSFTAEENRMLRKFERFFNNLTEEQQNEYVEKVKNNSDYTDSYTPYIRNLWFDSNDSESIGKTI